MDDYWVFDYSKFTFPAKGDNLDVVRAYYGYFAHPAVPFAAVAMYLLFSGPFCDAIRSSMGLKRGGSAIKGLTIVHSFLLTVYSGWTFYNVFKIVSEVHGLYSQAGQGFISAFYSMCCDGSGTLWNKHDLGSWIWHFYISKFYEFVDTWIILLKGDQPMLLQTYHHAGVVLIMWSMVVTHNVNGGMIITVLNSGIHTIMYTYYVFMALKIELPRKVKKIVKSLITSSQLTQFVVGVSASVPTYFISGCLTEAQVMSQAAIQVYTVILIGLFADFFYKEYVLEVGKKKK